MARPRADRTKIRSINVTIRLTEGEHQELKAAAGVCGKLPVTFIREKIFKGRFPSAQLSRIEIDTYLELKKTGTNLDHLTRLAQAGEINMELVKILMRLMRQQAKIIEQILYHDRYSKDR